MPKPTPEQALEAARDGNAKTLRQYLEAGGDANMRGESGQLTLLHLAATGGHLGAVSELTRCRGCRINEPSGRNGDTALIMAVKRNHESVARHLLLLGGCDLNASNRAGFTALMKAAKRGAGQLALLLMQHGAELEAASERGGHTALTLAVTNQRLRMVDLLLQFGASLEHCTASGKTAEDIAYELFTAAGSAENSKSHRIYEIIIDTRDRRMEFKHDTGLPTDVLNGQYRIIEKIGSGTFGSVFLVDNLRCRDSGSDSRAVVKVMQPRPNRRTLEIHHEGEHEAKLMLMIDHSQVARIEQYFKLDKSFCIVMEYCEFGDLDVWIRALDRKRKQFPAKTVTHWLLQLLLALNYLHSNKIIHRDIKPKNIFLKQDATAKIGDFGFSRRLLGEGDYASTVAGTIVYMCPEILRNLSSITSRTVDVPIEKYDAKCDVWSLGCTLYELCTLQLPFDPERQKEQVCGNTALPSLPGQYPDEMDALFKSMLARERKERTSCRQLLDSTFARERLKDMKKNGCIEDLRFLQNNAHLVKRRGFAHHVDADSEADSDDRDTLTLQAAGMHRLWQAVDSVLQNQQPAGLGPNYNLHDDSISDTVPDSIVEALAERVKWSGFPLEQIYRRTVVNLSQDASPEARRKDYARFTDDLDGCEQVETLVVCEMSQQ